MPMHRALLMTLPEFGEAGHRALALIRRALERFGFEDFVLLPTGARLTRASVHAALDELAERAGPDDACVVYYFGHGQRVVFEDLEGPHAARPFSYLRCDREHEHEFDALLDIPLRTRLHRLARACNNLTVILDACHSGRLVRSIPRRRPTPGWLHDELARHDPRGAPPIVCFAGAPPLSEAVRVREDDVGHLTVELCAALDEIAERRAKVSWHALAHRVRGRVITNSGSEYQWIVASGPVERGLFSSEHVADADAVGYVVTPAQTWLRVGRLQGSELGDRWALLDLDERELVRGEIREVDFHRSVLALERPPERPLEGHARLLRAANPTRIALDPTLLGHCGDRLERSAWLRVDPRHAEAELVRAGERMLLRERDGSWPNIELPLDACDAALELLEDRARSRRLLALPCGDADLLRITGVPAHLRPGEPLALQLTCTPDNPDTLYVALVLIDPLGRAWQLAPDQAEGIQVARNQPCPVVTESATAWPTGIDTDSLPCTLVAIAVDRPVQLGALVRPHPGGHEELSLGLAVPGRRMRGDAREPRPPLEARRWAVVRVSFELLRG